MSAQTPRECVKSALRGIGAPCEYMRYDGGKKTYFVFHIVSDAPAAHGDGKPVAARYRIQLDRCSPDHQGSLDENAKKRLIDAGLTYIGGHDSYHPEEKIYRRVQEFYFFEEE